MEDRTPNDGLWSLAGTVFLLLAVTAMGGARAGHAQAADFRATVVDADSHRPIPARVYLRNEAGQWLFVKTTDPAGSALPYSEQWVPMPNSVDQHTTVSAHPFYIDLPPGRYKLEVERGKEYRPYTETFEVGRDSVEKVIRLQRWMDMASRGWYSGETHVHRRISELPNVMLAEDLNVAFPVTFWTTQAFTAPDRKPSPLRRQGPSPFGDREDRGYEPIWLDQQHVIFPRNTEYEIFSVGEERTVLGAVFVLNHRTVFEEGMPPVGPLARRAHEQGALLDLDKHSWPWSMMLVPVAGIDLYELSNNSVWRTEFGFRQPPVAPADYMQVESSPGGLLTERGWLDFGFQNYYALLNCGFRLSPTAGTASGVHPVPLGYSRVYVHVPGGFDAQAWLEGLRAGRSFVSTGPMLFATLDDELPGSQFRWPGPQPRQMRLKLEAVSDVPLERVEIIRNGSVVETLWPPESGNTAESTAYRIRAEQVLELDRSSWLAVRCFSRPEPGRVRFAHTGPWHIELDAQPVRPRRVEVEYLIERVERELDRLSATLPEKALAEYRQALEFYRGLRERSLP